METHQESNEDFKDYVIGVDIGTHITKPLLVDADRKRCRHARQFPLP
jgi:sugar (pentulose or hexulose) kinase